MVVRVGLVVVLVFVLVLGVGVGVGIGGKSYRLESYNQVKPVELYFSRGTRIFLSRNLRSCSDSLCDGMPGVESVDEG